MLLGKQRSVLSPQKSAISNQRNVFRTCGVSIEQLATKSEKLVRPRDGAAAMMKPLAPGPNRKAHHCFSAWF